MAMAFGLSFSFGWAVALHSHSRFVTEPWGWFWLWEQPWLTLAAGIAGGIVGAILFRKVGWQKAAPLALSVPAAIPFIPAWFPLAEVYQAVAVDFAWLLLAAAFFGTLINLAPEGLSGRAGRLADSPIGAKALGVGLPVLFVAVSLLLFNNGERIKKAAGFTGDSPQYLLIANALVHDWSVDLMPSIMREDHIHWINEPIGGHGKPHNGVEHYSKYKSGFSAALAPFFAAGWWTGGDLRLWMVFAVLFFGGATAWMLWGLLHRDLGLSPSASAMGAASVMFTFPMIVYSSQIYPEIFAALMVAIMLRMLARAEKAGLPEGVIMGAAVGMLLFQHERFFFFGGPAIAAYFWLTRKRVAKVWPAYILTLIAFAALNIGDLYARHFPIIPAPGQHGRAGGYWNPEGVYTGWFGALFDMGHGLLPYAPLFIMAPAWIIVALRQRPGLCAPLLALGAGVYLMVLSYAEWWGGLCPPGNRYLVAYYPLMAVFAGVFWETRPARWVYWLFFLLAGAGLAVSHNYFLQANDDYMIHLYFMERRFAAFDPTRVFYNFIFQQDQAGRILAWFAALGLASAAVMRWRTREIETSRLGAAVASFLFLGTAIFYALFPQSSLAFTERQRVTFGAPKDGQGRLIWSKTGGKIKAVIPAEYMPSVGHDITEDGWTRLAPGAKAGGFMMFGKYIKLPPGRYRITIPMRVPEGAAGETGFFEVVDFREEASPAPLKEFRLADGAVAEFTLDRPMLNIEPRFYFDGPHPVETGDMTIEEL